MAKHRQLMHSRMLLPEANAAALFQLEHFIFDGRKQTSSVPISKI